MARTGVYNKDDIHFMPDKHAAVHRRGRKFAYILTIFSLLFLISMGAWAHYAVLDEVTRGEGRVVPSSKTQVVQHLEGGIVADLLVREGDLVEKGDVLVRIDNTTAQADFSEAESRYYSLSVRESRLVAELGGADRITFSEEVLEEAPSEVADARSQFLKRKQQLDAQLSVLEAQTRQRKQEIAEMQSRQDQLRRSLALAREELGITRPLVQRGVMPKLDLIRVEREVADLEGEMRTVQTSIPRLEAALEEAKRRVEETRITRQAEVSEELNKTRAEMSSLTSELATGEDRVTRTEVRSPVRGTIKQLNFNTIGSVLQPGAEIIQITPLDDTLLVEAKIRPADIAFLRPDQEAVIKISAYDFSIYGGLKGKLEQISADTIEDEEKDESFYKVYLRTNDNKLVHNDQELPIIPGMTATAEILTGKKSVLDYLLKPILKTRDRALTER